MANRLNNESGVSPIVATLVLIVVAVIGAVGVGIITGSFSTDVSKEIGGAPAQAADVSSIHVLVVGSNLMLPTMVNVSKDYMAQHPGIIITVQGGGSLPAGLYSVANGIADIGTFSFTMRSAQNTAYPNVREYVVGYEGIVPIVNNKSTVTSNVSLSDLERAYSDDFGGSTLPPGINRAVVITTAEGYSDTFAFLTGIENIYSTRNASIQTVGNSTEAINYVASHPNTIGYAPLEYAISNPDGITILDYNGTPKTRETDSAWPVYTWQSIRDAKNNVSNPLNFPAAGIHNLELLTLLSYGQPNSLDMNIISFTRRPDEAFQFHINNLVHVSDTVTY